MTSEDQAMEVTEVGQKTENFKILTRCSDLSERMPSIKELPVRGLSLGLNDDAQRNKIFDNLPP